MKLPIYHSTARSILSPTTGYIRDAGFTHSLTPARNCTFGCTYCYVPTMNVYGGLTREDWERWGQFTTFKENAPELLRKELRSDQVIYCSPLVDPYQPAEETELMMRSLLGEVIERPPRRFVVQTRGPLVLRDVELLRRMPGVRVSVSVTTDSEEMRRRYEPLCAPIAERLAAIRTLNEAGIPAYAALAPLLPCDPERLACLAMEATPFDLIGDALHVRAGKRSGATTREAALRIAEKWGQREWLALDFQGDIAERIDTAAGMRGRQFRTGPDGFAQLAR